MDDAYSNKSWAVAAGGAWTVKEIDRMEMEMLGSLGWRIREAGEDLGGTIEGYEEGWERRKD